MVVCANVRRDQRLLSRCGEVRESLGKEAQQRAARDEAGGGGAGWRFRATPLPLLAFSGECLSGGAVARGCRSRAAFGAGVTTGKYFELHRRAAVGGALFEERSERRKAEDVVGRDRKAELLRVASVEAQVAQAGIRAKCEVRRDLSVASGLPKCGPGSGDPGLQVPLLEGTPGW